MKGRWAAGIVPRNFAWIVKGQLAVSERPGGYAPHHRRVRRHEELLWLRSQGFTRVVSLLGSRHNLHAYEEHELPYSHFPLPAQGDLRPMLGACYPALLEWLRAGERILLHHEELGDRAAGVAAGFLCWSGLLPDAPQATTAVEHLLKRQLGSLGRSIVAAASDIAPEPAQRFFRPSPVPSTLHALGERRAAVAGDPEPAPRRTRRPRPSSAPSSVPPSPVPPAPGEAPEPASAAAVEPPPDGEVVPDSPSTRPRRSRARSAAVDTGAGGAGENVADPPAAASVAPDPPVAVAPDPPAAGALPARPLDAPSRPAR